MPLQLRDLIIDRPINFDLIKCEKASKLLQIILEKDPEKRASLEDIAKSDWLTNDGKDKIDFMVDEQYVTGPAQNELLTRNVKFGNYNRLIKK